MKRKNLIIAFLFFIFGLMACGDKTIDPVAQKVISDIDGLGEITLEDENNINQISELYLTLTDEQKNQVTNYITLLEAQDTIKELKAEDLAANKEKYEKQPYKDAIEEVLYLRENMRSPESFNLSDIECIKEDSSGTYIFRVDYVAENQMGGLSDGTAIVTKSYDETKINIYFETDTASETTFLGFNSAILGTLDGFSVVDIDCSIVSEGMEYYLAE